MQNSERKESTYRKYFKKYFKETTVHGFRYVVEGISVYERASWACVILVAMSYTTYTVVNAGYEYQANPVSTTYSSASRSLAPFPKITVDGGNVWDPMGFTKEALRGAQSDAKDTLNKKFFFLSEKVFQRVYYPMVKYLETHLTMEKYHSLLKGTILNSSLFEDDQYRDVLDNFFSLMNKGSQIHQLVVHMATMEPDYPKNIEKIYKEFLELPTCLSFLNMGIDSPSPSRLFRFTSDVFSNLTNNGPTISADNFKECSQVNTTQCEKPLLKATSRILTLEYLDRSSKLVSPLGEFLSWIWIRLFQRPFLSRVPKVLLNQLIELQQVYGNEKKSRTYPIQDKACLEDQEMGNTLTELDQAELFMNQYLINVTKSMSTMELDLSFYELSLLLDFPMFGNCPYLHQANYIQDQHGCSFRKYRGKSKTCGTDEEDKDIFGCCKIRNQISQMHEFILRVMKHNQQAPQFGFDTERHLLEFENASTHFGIKMDLSEKNQPRHKNPRILACNWLSRDRNFPDPAVCNLFHRDFTNTGIGFSFNNAPFEHIYKKSPFMEIFRNIMDPDSGQSEDKIGYLKASGPQKMLRVFLQGYDYLNTMQNMHANLDLVQYTRLLALKREFKIAISNPNSLPDLRSNYIEIKPGFQYKILITPVQYNSDPSIETLSYGERNCRMSHEVDGLRVMGKYSQSGCILECQLKRALEICRCIPWNYPHFQEANGRLTDVCDYDGNACVDQLIDSYNQTESITDCQCYPECDTFAYSYSLSINTLDDLCENMTVRNILSSNFYNDNDYIIGPVVDALLPGFTMDIKSLYSPEANLDFCKQKKEEIAIVGFQVIGQGYTIISRNVRTTFISALANLGGLVGLVSGMSVLSLFEMFFWLCGFINKIVNSFLWKCKTKIADQN